EAEAGWRGAVQRGGGMPNRDSGREKKTLSDSEARQELLDDPLYEPVHPFMREAGWDTVVSVPLIYRNQAVGALNVFYPRGKNPSEAEIAFLTVIADQGAVAAENARLCEEARRKTVRAERQRRA